ncbi:cytokinin riboside 5'-monophosphate phosphoribohydrolase [Longispora fulva]|uniref:Cytokinin riboside 5'-monophosphate phosphoribohydrolase n=1 Tax=Longispora fulva TaxID=619741 RepID=A0A8J7KHQ5_9ACTN|nr:TIGR00730 family Rossman fold protein [Longispora fulva]MBG6138840.1 uncharacterized protein (TIGR00730 family) [Longispora fulva]GIG58334.1 cytokinin riboside 5'-monophosphate phosphoribohydrolase [Longispora fulva]
MAAICVFCASSTTLAPGFLNLATATGAALAEAGHVLVSGGGRVGMMGAVAAGARGAGGHTVGIIPRQLQDREVADLDADELVVTETMADRKTLLIERSDAFVVLPGGLGTLDELFEVWTVAGLGFHPKPIIVVNADGFYDGLLAWLDRAVADGMVRADAVKAVTVVGDLDAALALL